MSEADNESSLISGSSLPCVDIMLTLFVYLMQLKKGIKWYVKDNVKNI